MPSVTWRSMVVRASRVVVAVVIADVKAVLAACETLPVRLPTAALVFKVVAVAIKSLRARLSEILIFPQKALPGTAREVFAITS